MLFIRSSLLSEEKSVAIQVTLAAIISDNVYTLGLQNKSQLTATKTWLSSSAIIKWLMLESWRMLRTVGMNVQ